MKDSAYYIKIEQILETSHYTEQVEVGRKVYNQENKSSKFIGWQATVSEIQPDLASARLVADAEMDIRRQLCNITSSSVMIEQIHNTPVAAYCGVKELTLLGNYKFFCEEEDGLPEAGTIRAEGYFVQIINRDCAQIFECSDIDKPALLKVSEHNPDKYWKYGFRHLKYGESEPKSGDNSPFRFILTESLGEALGQDVE